MAGGDRGALVEHRVPVGDRRGHHRLGGLAHRQRLAGQRRLVGLQPVAGQHPAVGRDGVARPHRDHVAGHQFLRGHHLLRAVAQHPGGHRRAGQQLGQRTLGVVLVHRADQRRAAHHPADQRGVDQRAERGGEHRPGGEHRGERVRQLVHERAEQPGWAVPVPGHGTPAAGRLLAGQPIGVRTELVEDDLHRHQVPGGERGRRRTGPVGQPPGPPDAVREGEGGGPVHRREGPAGQPLPVGGERTERSQPGAGHRDPDVLPGHPPGHPGRVDEQGGNPQVVADQQVRAPGRQVLRGGHPQPAVGGPERGPVTGDHRHHRALALQVTDRVGEPGTAGHEGVGEVVPAVVVPGDHEPQAGLARGGRQGVHPRDGLRFDPQHGGEPAALGQPEQPAAVRAQPRAVRGVPRVRHVHPVQRAEPPAVGVPDGVRGGRVEQGERPGGHLAGVRTGQRCQVGQHAPVGAEHRGVQQHRVDPVQLAQHAAVHDDHAPPGEHPAELRGVPLAATARGLGQRRQGQRGGPLPPGHRHRGGPGRRTRGQHTAHVALGRAVRNRAGPLAVRYPGDRPVRVAGQPRLGLRPGGELGPRLTPLHHPLRAVEHDAGPAAAEPLGDRLGEREEHVGAGVGAQPPVGECVQLRVQVDRGEEAGHLAGDRGERQDPGGRRDGQAQRVRDQRAQGAGGARALLGRMRRRDLRVRLVRAHPLGPRHGGDQVAQLRLRLLDRHDHPARRRVDPGPGHPGQGLQRRLHLPGQPVPAVLADAVHLDVVPAVTGPDPAPGQPGEPGQPGRGRAHASRRLGDAAGHGVPGRAGQGGSDGTGGVRHGGGDAARDPGHGVRHGDRRQEEAGDAAQRGHRGVRPGCRPRSPVLPPSRDGFRSGRVTRAELKSS
ncbi:hypothetical protein B0E53_04506 [Micromonospora sp. MH33]|nr:hypothetical protein B0E53_04506 [Micromonospora sp. MH33]